MSVRARLFWNCIPLAALASIFLPVGTAVGQDGIVEITGFGEFGTPKGKKVAAPDTAAGTINEVDTRKLLRRTDCIVARLGGRFGVLVRHVDPRHPSFVDSVQIEVSHPPFMKPGGGGRTVDSWPAQLQVSSLYSGWRFERSYELEPGPWTIAVTYKSEILAKKTFEVVTDRAACGKTS